MVKKLLYAFAALGFVVSLLVGGWAAGLLLSPPVQSDTVTIPNAFFAGQVADPSAVNANFTALANVINGKIDNDNWDPAGPDIACSNIDTTSACVNSTYIIDGQVGNADLANNSVNTNKIVDESILSADIFNSTLTTDDILDGTVGSTDIALGAVTTTPATANPGNVTNYNPSGAFGDIGASWSVTSTLASSFLVMVNVNVVQNTPGAGSDRLSIRLVSDGTNGPVAIVGEGSLNNSVDTHVVLTQIEPVGVGSITIKLQAMNTTGDTYDFTDMYLNVVELKR